MQVELSVVTALASAILAGYIALGRFGLAAKEKALEDRFLALEKDVAADTERINVEEKATIHLYGELKLLNQNHTQISRDVDEIKRSMVTKAEWEQRTVGMERTMGQILADIRAGMGRYPSGGSGAPPALPRKT